MDDIINRISELNLNVYYEPSNGYVVAWFSNNATNKPDIVAYLQDDMSWDVREITSEISILYSDKEVVEIKHEPLRHEIKGSEFDRIIYSMFGKLIERADFIPPEIKKAKEILDRGSYSLVVGNN